MLISTIAAILLSAHLSDSAETVKAATVFEAAEKRTYREKRFLLRAVDEMNESLKYVKETAGILGKQIDAIALLEPRRREDDLWDFMNWYQDYGQWLRGHAADFNADAARALSDDKERAFWVDRYSDMADGYTRLANRLTEKMYTLEDDRTRVKERLRDHVDRLHFLRRRFELDRTEDHGEKPRTPDIDSSENGTRDRGRKREAIIFHLENEIRDLVELVRHLDVLVEVGRAERDWLSRKERDSIGLSRVARVLGSTDPDPIEEAYSRIIKTYEADLSSFRRSRNDVDRKRLSIPPTGTLRTLDRTEELADHYKHLKIRYEQHIAWLAVQIENYRAELTELRIGR